MTNTDLRYRLHRVNTLYARYRVLDVETGRWADDGPVRGLSLRDAQALADMLNRDDLEVREDWA